MAIHVKDKLGREIKVGDVCVISRSDIPMWFGKIVEVNKTNRSIWYQSYKNQGRTMKLETLLRGDTGGAPLQCKSPTSRVLILKRPRL